MFSVSLAGSGDLLMDGFKTEEEAYTWMRFKYGYDSIPEGFSPWFEGFIIEPENYDDNLENDLTPIEDPS